MARSLPPALIPLIKEDFHLPAHSHAKPPKYSNHTRIRTILHVHRYYKFLFQTITLLLFVHKENAIIIFTDILKYDRLQSYPRP